MNLDITKKHDHWYITINNRPNWKSNTFFPIVDSMLGQIKQTYEGDPRPVVFDISRLEYVDSTFISLIIQTVRFTSDHKNAIITPSAQSLTQFNLLGIDQFVDIYTSEDEWEKSLAS